MKITDAYVTLGEEREQKLAAGDLLRLMDAGEIHQAVVFPDDRERTVANDSGNLRILNAVRPYSDRLIAGFSVNPWLGKEGIPIVQRAREGGAKILLVDARVQGFLLSDPLAHWLWHWAGETGTPVHVRTTPSSSACPSQLWFLADAFPDVRWILGGGGTTDYTYDLGAVAKVAPENLWFEVSTMRDGSILNLLKYIAEDRALFGSAAPQQEILHEFCRMRSLLPQAIHSRFFSANLEGLL